MKDLRNLRNRPFLVINTVVRPARGVHTSKKGWSHLKTNLAIFEQASVVDRVSDRVMRNAHLIIDITRGSIVTSRFETAEEADVLKHYLEKYDSECDQGIKTWINKMASTMARDPKFIAELEARKAEVAAENAAASDEATLAGAASGEA